MNPEHCADSSDWTLACTLAVRKPTYAYGKHHSHPARRPEPGKPRRSLAYSSRARGSTQQQTPREVLHGAIMPFGHITLLRQRATVVESGIDLELSAGCMQLGRWWFVVS